MFGPDGEQCSSMTLKPDGGKGLYTKGKPVGLFLPGCTPKPGETWHGVEGVKDAAALHGLGLQAFGLPCSSMNAKFARLFRGVDVVLLPDRDRAGAEGSEKTAAVLIGVARSVKVATLPAEFKESGGVDVRDILKTEGGEALVRQAIADARLIDAANPASKTAGKGSKSPGAVKILAERKPAAFPDRVTPLARGADPLSGRRLVTRYRPQEAVSNVNSPCQPWGRFSPRPKKGLRAELPSVNRTRPGVVC